MRDSLTSAALNTEANATSNGHAPEPSSLRQTLTNLKDDSMANDTNDDSSSDTRDQHSNRKTASSSPYSTTSTSPTAGLESDSGSSKVITLVNAGKHGTSDKLETLSSNYASSHEIDSDSGIGSSKEILNASLSPPIANNNGTDKFYKLRLDDNGFSDIGEESTYRNTPTTSHTNNFVNNNTNGNDTSYYGSLQSKVTAAPTYKQRTDDGDELKRSHDKKLREKDTIISDMRDEHRREMVRLRQRHEQERIELTAYGEEQKRLYTESQTLAKEVKRELQDKKWTLEMIQSDISSNKDQASLIQRRMDMVQKELNLALDDRDRLIKIKKDLENALYDATSEASDLKSSRQAIQSAQTGLKNDFLNLQEDIVCKDETITGLEERVAKLQVDITRLVKDKESQEIEIDEKDKQIGALKRQVENCNQKLRDQELNLHSANHYKKQLADVENRAREMEDEFYMKENKYKEKLEELEYELDILQNNTRITSETTIQENTDLKRKNQSLEEKMEEAKKKAFQTELKMQETETQLKLAQRQIRKLEDRLESVEINYNALLKRTRTGNYGRVTANPSSASSYAQSARPGYSLGREYYDVMSASAIVTDGYEGTASEYGWPRVNRGAPYGRRFVRSVTPVYDAPEQYDYGYDPLSYGADEPGYTTSTRLASNEGWADENPPSHFKAPKNFEDADCEGEHYMRSANGAYGASRRNGAVDTYLDEYGFERPILNSKKKGSSSKTQSGTNSDLKSSMVKPNTPTPEEENVKNCPERDVIIDSHNSNEE